MKNTVKMGLAFIAGGVIFNSPLVLSNMPDTGEALSKALASAMQKVNEYEQRKEDAALEKLPNILDCQNMQWMKNCSEINKQAKKNPNAPLRVLNPQGIEFNFVPGTPSAVMRLQLEQSPEAARAAVTYMDQTWGEYKKSASLYQKAQWEMGDLPNIIGLDRAKAIADAPKAINQQGISLSVFVHSLCGACDVQLTTMAKLQERYPNLKITVFQFDDNPAGFKAKVTDRGLKGRILTSAEGSAALKAGVAKWPTTWVDNIPMRKREALTGTRSLIQLEERLQAMTHIITARK